MLCLPTVLSFALALGTQALLGSQPDSDARTASAPPSQATSQAAHWSAGQPAPPLRLPTVDGQSTLDLQDLRGRPVLLIEFASW